MRFNRDYRVRLEDCVVLDIEVAVNRWLAGLYGRTKEEELINTFIDQDQELLSRTIEKLLADDRLIVTYNGLGYDMPVLLAILAGEDPFPISQRLVTRQEQGIPNDLFETMREHPWVFRHHIDLSKRTKQGGRFPGLKTVGANLGTHDIRELPFDPEQPVSDEMWAHVKDYNRVDLKMTHELLVHLWPEVETLGILSSQFDINLLNTPQPSVARKVLESAYRRMNEGRHPVRMADPVSVRYRPHAIIKYPSHRVVAAWFDRLVSEEFPIRSEQEGGIPKPIIPDPDGEIRIGDVLLSLGKGGIHTVDPHRFYRPNHGRVLMEADVASYYPFIMVNCGISPASLGECGRDFYREILDTRLEIKERAGTTEDKAQAKFLKQQADGLKIVLNATFGQLGNYYSALYDPEAMLGVTLSGQLLLVDLLERLNECGVALISANTDGIIFEVDEHESPWKDTLAEWQERTGMSLEINVLEAVLLSGTNNYATISTSGKIKRRGTLLDQLDWEHVPRFLIVADALFNAMFHGTLPEATIRGCQDPLRFTSLARRHKNQEGVWIDQATGTESPAERLIRFYKAEGSPRKLEHRWTTEDGKAHTTTPSKATGIRPLMSLPETLPEDLNRLWYANEARYWLIKHTGFPHLDPRWLDGYAIPQQMHQSGLCPIPKVGKDMPAASKVNLPSYFWSWDEYATYGSYTGPSVGILVLDIDDPGKFKKWIDKTFDPMFTKPWQIFDDAMVSYHRDSTAKAVRGGEARGKLIFRFKSGPEHPLAKIGVKHWRKSRGVEIFYGKGCPSLIGKHPDGFEHDYMLDGTLGDLPTFLADGLTPKTKPLRVRPRKIDPETDGKVALNDAVEKIASLPSGEGIRHAGLIKTTFSVRPLINEGIVTREQAEKALVEASTLPGDEAQGAVQWVLEKSDESTESPEQDVSLNKTCFNSPEGSTGELPWTNQGPSGSTGLLEIQGPGHGSNGEAGSGAGGAGGAGTGAGQPPVPPSTLTPRPSIVVNTELGRIRDEILALLPGDPDLYRRGNILMRLVSIETPTYKLKGGTQLRGTAGMPLIVPLDEASFSCRLTTRVDFIRVEKKKNGDEIEIPVHPPRIPLEAVLNNVSFPGVRAIEGIVQVPYLRTNNTLCSPGYDPETGIVYVPTVPFAPLPDAPTQQDAQDAAQRLFVLVEDFPFDTNEDKAVWLAGLIAMIARPMIAGPVPGVALIGNKAGIGKGKLVTAIGLIATGRMIPTTMYPLTKEETIKTKVSLGMAAITAVFFDNLEEGSIYGNGPLDSAITDPAMNERLMGGNKLTGDIELRPCWFLSGNNISPGKDAYRRWFPCNLKTRLENPEERDDIKIKDLETHIKNHREDFLRDVLIILKAHALAHHPNGKWASLGSFEHWDKIVRGAVWFATGWDCNKSRKAAAAEAPERLKKIALLEAWEATELKVGTKIGLTVTTAYALAAERDEENKLIHPQLHAAFMAHSKDGNMPSPETIGRRIHGLRDNPMNGKMIFANGKDCGSVIWKVASTENH